MMIKKYDLEYYEEYLGNIFEIAVLCKKIPLNEFVDLLLESKELDYIEYGDPKYLYGYSSSEIVAMILDENPRYYYQPEFASPEYWLGTILANISIRYRIGLKQINEYYPITRMIEDYFPYHEMDNRQYLDYISKYIPENIIKKSENQEYQDFHFYL